MTKADPWINRHFVPCSHEPSPGQAIKAARNVLVLCDRNSFTREHGRAFMSWHANPSLARDGPGEALGERQRRNDLSICAGVCRPVVSRSRQIVFPGGVRVHAVYGRTVRTCP